MEVAAAAIGKAVAVVVRRRRWDSQTAVCESDQVSYSTVVSKYLT